MKHHTLSGIQHSLIILYASLAILVLLSGCGPEVVTIDTRQDYIDSSELIEAPGLYISSVSDERGNDPAALGHITGQVSHNKTDIYLADSLSALIKNYYNDLLLNHTRTNPVEIEIKSFSLVENFSKKDEYHLVGSLIYNYNDGAGNRTSYASTISRDFSRDKKELAANVNAALRESLRDFIDKVDEEETDTPASVNSSTGPGYPGRSDSTVRSQIVYDEPVEVPQIESNPKHLGAGIAYYTGDKITGGMQVEFRMSWQRPDWEYGFSVGFFYVDFISPPYEGSLWALNLPWNMKYMLSPGYVSPYIGGTVKLIAGQNNESGTNSPGYYNSYDNVSTTFWGPTFEESFGLAFDRSVFIEVGVYEMFLFNTKILSDDVGFRLSLHFTVTK